MPGSIAQYFAHHFGNVDKETDWSKLVQCLLVENRSDADCVESLTEEILHRPIASFNDYLNSWRDTLILFFVDRLHGGVSTEALVKMLKAHAYFETFQLGRLFEAIVDGSSFQINQLPHGGILIETEGQLEELTFPRPQLTAELGVLALIHGFSMDDTDLLSAVLRFARFHMQMLDQKGKPFAGLWTGMKNFSYATSYAMNYLLFTTAAHLSPWPKFHLVAESQLAHLKELDEECLQKISPYLTLLALVMEKAVEGEAVPKVVDRELEESDEESLGFSTYQGSSLNIACTTSGSNSGVGAISKGHVRIVSMGPCYSPLGEPHTFGVHRSPPLRDTIIRRAKEEFEFNGWTRLVHPEKGHLAKSWMELQVHGSKGRGRVTVRFSELVDDLHFAFFVESQKAIVNENFYLQPASLDRYSGESTDVIFKMGDHSLKLLPQLNVGMQVIPLAGGDHYWGANFLVAFEMPKESTSVQWEIV
jgi:hypothetical protein